MKYLLTLLIFCVGFGVQAQSSWGWGSEKVRGNGDVSTQDRDVKNFDGVEACCGFSVEATRGSDYSVEVEAESNLQEYIVTEVRGGRLSIGFKDRVNVKSSKNIVVRITVPTLNYVAMSSGGDFRSLTAFSGEELELNASSGADIKIEFTGDRVSASASSGADVRVSGKGTSIRADASSAGNVKAGDFIAAKARANASSGGDVKVHATEDLKADASSGGGVRYNGSPNTVDVDRSSGGSVRKGL